jgi:hypothetical protein
VATKVSTGTMRGRDAAHENRTAMPVADIRAKI